MNLIIRLAGAVLMIGCTTLAANPCAAAVAPKAAEFYPLVGVWHGNGQLSEAGHPPDRLVLRVICQKAAAGWAVRCTMRATNEQINISESDLMGVDPVTGQAHWYAVTNQGDTHDHLVSWPNPHTMLAHHQWIQDGKHMREEISFKFTGRRLMHFRSVVTTDGKDAAIFSGVLKRK